MENNSIEGYSVCIGDVVSRLNTTYTILSFSKTTGVATLRDISLVGGATLCRISDIGTENGSFKVKSQKSPEVKSPPLFQDTLFSL